MAGEQVVPAVAEVRNLTRLPLEILREILSLLEIDDIFRCMAVSKYFRNVIISDRLTATVVIKNGKVYKPPPSDRAFSEVLDLAGSADWFFRELPNDTIIKRLEFYFPYQTPGGDLSLGTSVTRSYKVRELFLKLGENQMLGIIMSGGLGPLPFLRDLQLTFDRCIEVHHLKHLPILAPNLESLEVSNLMGRFFNGTNVFTKLKSFCFSGGRPRPLLGAISGFTRNMPNLTDFICSEFDFGEGSENFFESLPNLEYIHLELRRNSFIPIRSPAGKLKELRLTGGFHKNVVPQDPRQMIPLPNLETFQYDHESPVKNVEWHGVEYYGIGNNLKTLWIANPMKFGSPLNFPIEFWRKMPNLENLYASQSSSDTKHLYRITIFCTKLQVVALYQLRKCRGEGYNIDLISGLRKLYLNRELRECAKQCIEKQNIELYIGQLEVDKRARL